MRVERIELDESAFVLKGRGRGGERQPMRRQVAPVLGGIPLVASRKVVQSISSHSEGAESIAPRPLPVT